MMRQESTKFPWTVLASEFPVCLLGSVMGVQAGGQVVCVADVKLACRILEDVNPKHGEEKWLQRQGSNLQPAG